MHEKEIKTLLTAVADFSEETTSKDKQTGRKVSV